METQPPVVIDKLAWIALRDRRMLFVRTKGVDLFYTPGGKRHTGESDEQALAREIREELGVALMPNTVHFWKAFRAPAHGKPEGTLVEIRCYRGVHEGELCVSGEIEEMMWCSSADRDRLTVTGQMILDELVLSDDVD